MSKDLGEFTLWFHGLVFTLYYHELRSGQSCLLSIPRMGPMQLAKSVIHAAKGITVTLHGKIHTLIGCFYSFLLLFEILYKIQFISIRFLAR